MDVSASKTAAQQAAAVATSPASGTMIRLGGFATSFADLLDSTSMKGLNGAQLLASSVPAQPRVASEQPADRPEKPREPRDTAKADDRSDSGRDRGDERRVDNDRPAERAERPEEPRDRSAREDQAGSSSDRNDGADHAETAEVASTDTTDHKDSHQDGKAAAKDGDKPAAESRTDQGANAANAGQKTDGQVNVAVGNEVMTAAVSELVGKATAGEGGEAVKQAAQTVAALQPGQQKVQANQGQDKNQGQAALGRDHAANQNATDNKASTGPQGPVVQTNANQGQQATGQQNQAQAQAQAQQAAAAADKGEAGRQAADLSKAVGTDKPVSVNVNVTKEAESLTSKPSQALSGEALHGRDAGPKAGIAQNSYQQQAFTGNQQANGANNAAQQAMMGPQINIQAQQAQAQAQAAAGQAQGGDVSAIAKGGVQAGPQSGAQAPTAEVGNQAAPANTQPTQQTQQAAKPQAPQAPRPNVPPQQVVQQVTVNITKAASQGLDRINIQLRPEALGRIEVQLEMHGPGKVHATVIADRPETLDMLRNDARSLEKALADAGLQTDSGSMNFNLRENHGQAARQNGGDAGHGTPEDARQAEAEAAPPALSEQALADAMMLLGEGRVDIRA